MRTIGEVGACFEQVPWTFSKTMPQWPHYWSTIDQWQDPEAFRDCVRHIQAHGKLEPWGKSKPKHYLYVNGWRYWTMETCPAEKEDLINRNLPDYKAEYDTIADQYDAFHSRKNYIDENRQLVRLLKKLPLRGRVLDVGCGTGLLADWWPWNTMEPEAYQGIDPSLRSLQLFGTKHPELATRLRVCTFEDWHIGGYDTIVALFGVGSYLKPGYKEKMLRLLNPGGRAFLMHYAEPPDCYRIMERHPEHASLPPEDGGRLAEFVIETFENTL